MMRALRPRPVGAVSDWGMRIAAVRVFVDDLEAAASFYGALLGAGPTAVGEGWAVFDVGCDLVVEEVDARDAEHGELVGRFSGVSFGVDDVTAACESLRGRGVEIVAEPEVQSWGGVLAAIADPARNVLQLVAYPRPSGER